MTDEELIKRLLEDTNTCPAHVAAAAADRIEALVDEVERLTKELASGSFYKESDIDALQNHAEAAEAKVAKLIKALHIARVHVAKNAQGWSVSRPLSVAHLTVIDAMLDESEGEKK